MLKRYLPLLILLAVLGGLAYAVFNRSGHTFTDQQCADCHATTPIKGKRETLVMKEPVKNLCLRCHSDYLQNSLTHPVEMPPVNARPPADLPVSWEGKMTCSTCHDIHATPDQQSFGKAYLRRKVIGAEMCSACHMEQTGAAGQKKHAPVMAVAHMKYSQDKGPNTRGVKIDKLSRTCLTCHDGSVGTDVNSQVSSGSWKHGPSFSPMDPQGSHPIGIKYRAAERRGGFRPLAALNQAIKLVEGKVGCPSCHDLFSREPYMLVVSNATLCTECHNK